MKTVRQIADEIVRREGGYVNVRAIMTAIMADRAEDFQRTMVR